MSAVFWVPVRDRTRNEGYKPEELHTSLSVEEHPPSGDLWC